VRQPHALGYVLCADGGIEQAHLLGSIGEQRRQNLPHQLRIVHSDVPELVLIKDGIRIGSLHDFILE